MTLLKGSSTLATSFLSSFLCFLGLLIQRVTSRWCFKKAEEENSFRSDSSSTPKGMRVVWTNNYYVRMKSLLVNIKKHHNKNDKIIRHDPTEGMSSSLLGTFQTDWITGRSLETFFFFFLCLPSDRGGSFRRASRKRSLQRMRGNGGDKTIAIRSEHQHSHKRHCRGQGNSILSRSSIVLVTELARWKSCCASPLSSSPPHTDSAERSQLSAENERGREFLWHWDCRCCCFTIFNAIASRIAAQPEGEIKIERNIFLHN